MSKVLNVGYTDELTRMLNASTLKILKTGQCEQHCMNFELNNEI